MFPMENKLREPGGMAPDYVGMDADLFTMKVYHGGQIEVSKENVAKYVDEQVDYFDFCTGDWMSMLELRDFAARLGYEKNVLFYYKVIGQATFGSFEPINDDMDVFGMVSAGLPFRETEVYIVVPAKPVKIDFSLSDYKPIEISDDASVEDSVEDDRNDDEVSLGGEEDMPDEWIGQESTLDDDILHNIPVVDATQVNEKNTNDYMPEKRRSTSDVDSGVEEMSQHSQVKFNSDVEWSNDDLGSECESETDVNYKTQAFSNFNIQADMENPTFKIGMVFPTADHFRKAIREYSIVNNRRLRFSRNEKRRVRAMCMDGCPWVVFASFIGDDKKDTSVVIKTLNNGHTCSRVFDKKWISCSWLAEKYKEKWVDDPGWNANSFFREVRKKTGVQLSKWQYYRARKMALEKIQGTAEEQYAMLWDYCEALKESNPGTTVKMKLSDEENNSQFQRLYICFGACKTGWINGCRRVIGLDGCHIKGPHEGQLLAAVGIDGDNSMFPIAYAAVESECDATWTWFLDMLGEDLGIVNSYTVTWMTDKQKGLIDSVTGGFPNSEHRFYVRHLYNNFKLQHKGLHLKQIMWNAARATTMIGYKQEMEKMKLIDPAAYNWLASHDPQHWCRAFFSKDHKCDILLNNLCEVFNAAIVEARDQPIITCMEIIRRYISKRLVTRKESAMKWNHEVGPRVFKIIERNKVQSTSLIPDYCGDDKFEVRSYSMDQYRVDLSLRTCDCNRWQLSGIPCSHAIACILSRDLHVMEYVDDCYKKNTFVKAYETPMKPMHGPNLWRRTDANPPKPPTRKKMPGRPKKSCRKEPDEIRQSSTGIKKLKRSYITMTCRICGGKRHNRVGCPNKGPTLSQSSTPTGSTQVASSAPNVRKAKAGTRPTKGSSHDTRGAKNGTTTFGRKEKGKSVASEG